MANDSFHVSARIKNILLAVAATLVKDPADLVIHNRDDRLITRIETILHHFPALQRFFMCLGILAFDRLPFFWGYGLRRFVNLREDMRKDYAHAWMHSRFVLLHELFKGIRGLVLVCYFSHTDIWNYIGYTPHSYVSDRINLRRQITSEKIPDLAAPSDENLS